MKKAANAIHLSAFELMDHVQRAHLTHLDRNVALSVLSKPVVTNRLREILRERGSSS